VNATAEVSNAIQFAREPYDKDAWSSEIMVKHWLELGHSPDLPLAPDFEMYALIDQANKLRIYTVRVGEMLVGYAVFLLAPDMFVKSRLQAVCNLVYLEWEYRRGYTGTNLLKFANRELRDEGVGMVSHVVNERNPGLSILLKRMGAHKSEEIWTFPEGRG
jgi:hypothetical protein